MEKDSRIYVAGHTGLVGRSLVKQLREKGHSNLVLYPSNTLDLTDRVVVEKHFKITKPEYVFLAAAKVGGIMSNSTYPVDFLLNNLRIQNNVISLAAEYGAKKLLFFGSSCIYPKKCPQPVKEEYLLSGPLEPTNKSYAIAKIAGIELCKAYNKQYGHKFFSIMSTNLYGPYDNFDPDNSHVIPGLIRKFHKAKIEKQDSVILWGTGTPKREFLYVDDLTEATIMLMEEYEDYSNIINIGSGYDVSISDLANMIKNVVEYEGKIIFDDKYPDGTLKKLLDTTKIRNLGWEAKTHLSTGLKRTYDWFTQNYTSI